MKSASSMAMRIASKYSLKTLLFLPSLVKPHLVTYLITGTTNLPRQNYFKCASITSHFSGNAEKPHSDLCWLTLEQKVRED
jgi:hypothetical protein